MPMTSESHQKITAAHLSRAAYLYVRQSTLRQVLENTESTYRQYALRDRAVAMGWPLERVVVIDSDLGQSGASAADREGFQRLVTEVSLGRVGIVLGLEVSRLARNSTDWHRLLELCALVGLHKCTQIQPTARGSVHIRDGVRDGEDSGAVCPHFRDREEMICTRTAEGECVADE